MAHQLKTFQVAVVKLVLSSSTSVFTASLTANVLTQIATKKLKKLFCLTVPVFFARNVKNNKVDPDNASIYTTLKCLILNQQLEESEE